MDTFDLIDSFMTGTYKVTRRQADSYVDGRTVPGASSIFYIEASVQPLKSRDLLRLPEGRRAEETQVLFTTAQLQVGGQGAALEADQVEIDGQQWEIQQVERWKDGTPEQNQFFRCLAQVTK